MRLSIFRPDPSFCQVVVVPELAYRMMLEDKTTQKKHGITLLPGMGDDVLILEGDRLVGQVVSVESESSDDWESMYEQAGE